MAGCMCMYNTYSDMFIITVTVSNVVAFGIQIHIVCLHMDAATYLMFVDRYKDAQWCKEQSQYLLPVCVKPIMKCLACYYWWGGFVEIVSLP